jgi:hypothetical protein
MTSIQTRALLCVAIFSGLATTLTGATHTITVSVSGTKIKFKDNGDSQNGDIVLMYNETVNWKCDTSGCSSITVLFKTSPCQSPPTPSASVTCSINDNQSHPKLYRYKITVDTISVDPHVIVDNQVKRNGRKPGAHSHQP